MILGKTKTSFLKGDHIRNFQIDMAIGPSSRRAVYMTGPLLGFHVSLGQGRGSRAKSTKNQIYLEQLVAKMIPHVLICRRYMVFPGANTGLLNDGYSQTQTNQLGIRLRGFARRRKCTAVAVGWMRTRGLIHGLRVYGVGRCRVTHRNVSELCFSLRAGTR